VTSLSIRLEARSAAHRCYRAYAIDVATDLFGAWLVDMSYGRIGTIGRSKIRSFATIAFRPVRNVAARNDGRDRALDLKGACISAAKIRDSRSDAFSGGMPP
jgi:predicted DNA-binding WGR domain protein